MVGKSPMYQATTEDRWQHYFRSPPTKLGFGSLAIGLAKPRRLALRDPLSALEESSGNWSISMLQNATSRTMNPTIQGMRDGREHGREHNRRNIWGRRKPGPRLDMSLLPKVCVRPRKSRR
jgi:hypothetical protein